MHVSQYVCMQGTQFPTYLPKGACLFGVALRVANDAGFHVIKLLTVALGFFCLKSLEAQGVLQRDTSEGMLPFSHHFMLTELLLPTVSSPALRRESPKGNAVFRQC